MKNLLEKYHSIKLNLKKKYPSMKRFLFGMKTSDGFIFKMLMYFLIFVMGFVFIYPILYMFSISMMSNVDLVDSTVRWVPTKLNFLNYELMYRALKLPSPDFSSFLNLIKSLFKNSLVTTFFVAGLPTLFVGAASALIGYGLSRFNFFGKKLIIILMIFTFILPKTLFFIPTYQVYLFIDNTLNTYFGDIARVIFNIEKIKLRSTLFPILAPAITGQGLQSAFFILVFYQFFSMIPKSLEEAALIDGANSLQIFYKIALPTAVPAIIITSVYGFSLYWNETFLLNFYTENKFQTIPSLLANIDRLYQIPSNMNNPRDPNLSFTETKRFAATLLSILPLIGLYAIVQRWFIESIDKSGITGE